MKAECRPSLAAQLGSPLRKALSVAEAALQRLGFFHRKIGRASKDFVGSTRAEFGASCAVDETAPLRLEPPKILAFRSSDLPVKKSGAAKVAATSLALLGGGAAQLWRRRGEAAGFGLAVPPGF